MMDCSDDRLALDLAELWQGRFAYDLQARRWRVRRYHGWTIDATLEHLSEARTFLRGKADLLIEGARGQDRRTQNKAAHAARQLCSAWKIRHVLALARTDRKLLYVA